MMMKKTTAHKKNRKPIFVLIIPRFEDLSNSFFAGEVTRGANIAASRLDVDILIHMVERKDHGPWLKGLLDPNFVDGMLFADIDRDWDVVTKAIRFGIPTMVLNNPSSEPFNCIAINNRKAAREAVEHLIRLGHRKIATVAGDLNTQAGHDRLEGYYEALEAAGLPKERKWVKKGGFLRTPARTAAHALLTASDKPTAIFAASDVMALEVMDAAKSFRIKIPEDLSIIGFDRNLAVLDAVSQLTTFEQPIVDMARLGIESLYQMSLGLARLPVKIMLEAKMVKGKTTAAVK